VTLLEPNEQDLKKGVAIEHVAKTFRPMMSAPLIATTGFDKARGMDILRGGDAEAIAYGSLYIANPDLVARL
jgi:N-ethylmaleimide reductase